MAYTYTPYKPSTYVQQLQRRQDQATNIYNQWANQQYHAGAGGYQNEINTAQQRLNNLYNNNNLSQTFKYGNQAKYNKALNAVVDRKPFEYDLSNDQLFQQYKDQYEAMGKAAMADTIGQASSMTGGYGNSYATAAGAQTYNNYLQEINSSIGDFYSMALAGYNAESDRLNNAFNAMSSDRTAEQNEWAGNWNVYTNLYNMYSNDYNNMLDRDRDQYNQHGQNLYNAANLYTNQYGTASSNDINVWGTGQNLQAEQASQAEAARHNQASEAAARSAASSSSRSSGKGNNNNNNNGKTNTVTPKKTSQTDKYIKTFGKPDKANLDYVKSSVEKLFNGGILTAAETLYILEYYGINP